MDRLHYERLLVFPVPAPALTAIIDLMEMRTLQLQNFRNYKKAVFNFDEKITIITGPNGSGKTNILEAVMLLSLGKSQRVSLERELINVNSDFARLVGHFDSDTKLELAIKQKENSKRVQKIYKVNNVAKTAHQFIGNSKTVQFAPEDIRLVAGSPARRREYLDRVLTQVDRDYYKNLLSYNKVLKQRNKLLDQVRGQVLYTTHESQLSFWSEQLINLGQNIQKTREEFFEFAENNLKEISDDLFADESYLVLKYSKSEISALLLESVRQKELLMGVSAIGPHRDDFKFIATNKHEFDLKAYGSRGQQRTGVLSIKILELKYIENKTKEKPILLLDDIFSELDTHYRKAVESVTKSQQTIITTADSNSVPKSIKHKAKSLLLKDFFKITLVRYNIMHMNSAEIRKRFIDFFVKVLKTDAKIKEYKKDLSHIEVPTSPLVPENHPTLLFVNSGMVQFTPYFLGKKDPVEDFGSKRLCSVQKSLRTVDLDIVGESNYHLTFFEMMGSWSIGDYGKQAAVELSYDLLTNKEYGFGFDPSKFIVTVFCGNKETECDNEAIDGWKSVGITEERISRLPASENWWAPGGSTGTGPCGPCTEVLYDRGPKYGPEEETPGLTDNPRYLEIWNAGVFMQYNRDEKGKLHKLNKMSVDTGAGLERFAVLTQAVDSVYETDLFVPIIEKIKELQKDSDMISVDFNRQDIKKALQRSADHIKASIFIIAEHVYPANKDQGFVLRRMLRRSFADFEWKLGIDPEKILDLIPIVKEMYKEQYPEVAKADHIDEVIKEDLEKYHEVSKQTRHVIKRNYLYRHKDVDAFDVYQSTGANRDLITAITDELGVKVNRDGFTKKLERHHARSREYAGKKFKGGLADNSRQTIKLHTATHLLHQALREVLGGNVRQMGSNITPVRLRFDFSYPEKIGEKDLKKIEKLVNQKINQKLPIRKVQMKREEAEKIGAMCFFNKKYGDVVTVYFTGNDIKKAWSKEFCGGPHVKNTAEVGRFKIISQEGIGKGIRRIKATTS